MSLQSMVDGRGHARTAGVVAQGQSKVWLMEPDVFPHPLRCWVFQLSEIRALRGLFGVPAYSMGYITQMGDGRYYLEDLSDCVPLDLSGADTTPGFFTGAGASLLPSLLPSSLRPSHSIQGVH